MEVTEIRVNCQLSPKWRNGPVIAQIPDEAGGGGKRQGMAREVFSLLRHAIKTINECEWPTGGLAMLRDNHLSLLRTDFKGEAALVEEVERERCWMGGIWAAVTVSDEIAVRAEPTAVSAWLVYTRTRASMPRLRSDIKAGSFGLSREERT